MRRRHKKLLKRTAVILAVLLAFAAGYTYDFLAQEVPFLPDRPVSHAPAGVPGRAPLEEITAIDLHNTYQADEVAFRRDYIGKTMLVTGVVSYVTSGPSETVVHLNTRKTNPNSDLGGLDFSNVGLPKVSCYFTGDNVFEPAGISGGDLVTLRGTVELERDLGGGWTVSNLAPALTKCSVVSREDS